MLSESLRNIDYKVKSIAHGSILNIIHTHTHIYICTQTHIHECLSLVTNIYSLNICK